MLVVISLRAGTGNESGLGLPVLGYSLYILGTHPPGGMDYPAPMYFLNSRQR